MIPKILLSFDVEEFDMPLEYGYPISQEEQLYIGKMGLEKISPILSDATIQTTLFTTANFACHNKQIIKNLSSQHEIASHTYFHSQFSIQDLEKSKHTLAEIINKDVVGLRMPRMQIIRAKDILDAGFAYDASIHPTWLPGRYNHFDLPTIPYMDNGLKRMPASVSTVFRIPLFWLSFKNMPYALYLKLALHTLKTNGFLSLYFHPWEFVDIHKYGLPAFTKKGCDSFLLDRLAQFIYDLKQKASFVTYRQFILEEKVHN